MDKMFMPAVEDNTYIAAQYRQRVLEIENLKAELKLATEKASIMSTAAKDIAGYAHKLEETIGSLRYDLLKLKCEGVV